MNLRGWTWIDENTEHDEDTTRIEALAREWSSIHDEIEQESFRCQAMREDGDDPVDHFDTHAEYNEWLKEQRIQHEQQNVRMEVIEELLARQGARMMRPYEHWNEDERYMQYMECDRFDESRW